MTSKEIKLTEIVVFGGGCFWCTEAIFQNFKGVISVMPGYSGGMTPNPTYEQVCQGNTGHVEAIKIEYDSKEISYEILLDVFFSTHDPTTMNKQGSDVGEQYQSVIFYADDSQKKQAMEFIAQLEKDKIFTNKIVTQIKPLNNFYKAEDYHKNYFLNHPENPYCEVVINPKLAKLRSKFASLLK